MSDCLQNEDSIVSDLSSSSADSLTGTLDSGDNINSDISIGDAMVSSISDGDSTDSNLGDDGSLYSELVIGGGGGIKYTGQETDSIVVTVDNNVYTISASLKPIKFNSISDFPLVGSEKLIYVDFSNKALYGWDSAKGVYYKLVADVKIPTKLSEFTNDAGFITNTVNNLVEYYKKTETYTQEEIDSKISAIPKFAIKVVTELPTTDISETTVYLVASGSDNQNLYIEYIYVDGVWEKLGEQTLDLSNVVNSINGKTGAVELNSEDVGALPSDTPLFSGNYNDLSNKPTIPTNNNQLTNGAGYITASRPAGAGIEFKSKDATHFMLYGNPQVSELYAQIKQADGTNHYVKVMDLAGKLYSNNKEVAVKEDIPTDYLPDSTRYGASIDLSINNTTYVVTAQLKDQDGNNLGDAKTIDLPLESVVVSGSYDATNKKVILTLKDGSTIDFSVADLVSGLQSEITSTNKLSVNLISGLSTIATSGNLSDATQDANNRTVTDAEKTAWNNKADSSSLKNYIPTADIQDDLTGGGSSSKVLSSRLGAELSGEIDKTNERIGEVDVRVTSNRNSLNAIAPILTEIHKAYLKSATFVDILDSSGDAKMLMLTDQDGKLITFDGNFALRASIDAGNISTENVAKWKEKLGYLSEYEIDKKIESSGGGTKIIWKEWS